MRVLVFFSAIILFLISCEQTYSPKPFGYYRIDMPNHEYQKFDTIFPYTFDYPKYSKIEIINSDSSWLNIVYPKNNAKIYITYKKVNNSLSSILDENQNFVNKHLIKADAIDEKLFINDTNKTYGTLYLIKGNAASSINFFLTDSVNNFLRGSLYFYCHPNKDSLKPVIDFIQVDVENLMKSLKWK